MLIRHDQNYHNDKPSKTLLGCPPSPPLDLIHSCSYLLKAFFEAASMMSQISHQHLLLVYGVSVHAAKSKSNKHKQLSLNLQPGALIMLLGLTDTFTFWSYHIIVFVY